MLSASAEQIGAAARLRELVHGEDRRKLNYVVHSPHPNPRYGVNPYAENPNYDPDVTDLLKDVAQRHHLPSEDIDLVEVMHDLKDLARRVRCKTGRHDPCVGIRAAPVAEAMMAIVLMDHALRQRAQNADVVLPIAAIPTAIGPTST